MRAQRMGGVGGGAVADHRFAAHWFKAWLCLFGVAIAASLAVTTLGFVEQMRVLGAMTLGAAVIGALVCLLGLRLYHPHGWRRVRRQVAGVRESARSATEALAQPRHALAEPRQPIA